MPSSTIPSDQDLRRWLAPRIRALKRTIRLLQRGSFSRPADGIGRIDHSGDLYFLIDGFQICIGLQRPAKADETP